MRVMQPYDRNGDPITMKGPNVTQSSTYKSSRAAINGLTGTRSFSYTKREKNP
eukprot:Pgem_evm1s8790